jgi:hypothetical protein
MSEVDNGTPTPDVDNGTPTPPAATPPATPPAPDGQWFDGFADEVKNDPSVQKFGSSEELAKSYINAQKLIGRDKIPMPVTDDDWADTWNRLGRPEDVGGYDIKKPEDMHPETVSPDDVDWLMNAAHKAGLNNEQAQSLFNDLAERANGVLNNRDASAEASRNEIVETLQNEWGTGYDANVKIAQTAIVEFADENFLQMLDDTGLGDNPELAKTFFNIGKYMMEDGKLKDLDSPGPSGADIDATISSLMAHKAYGDTSHPEHKTMVNKVTELFRAKGEMSG